jgi:hypothetical protein
MWGLLRQAAIHALEQTIKTMLVKKPAKHVLVAQMDTLGRILATAILVARMPCANTQALADMLQLMRITVLLLENEVRSAASSAWQDMTPQWPWYSTHVVKSATQQNPGIKVAPSLVGCASAIASTGKQQRERTAQTRTIRNA